MEESPIDAIPINKDFQAPMVDEKSVNSKVKECISQKDKEISKTEADPKKGIEGGQDAQLPIHQDEEIRSQQDEEIKEEREEVKEERPPMQIPQVAELAHEPMDEHLMNEHLMNVSSPSVDVIDPQPFT